MKRPFFLISLVFFGGLTLTLAGGPDPEKCTPENPLYRLQVFEGRGEDRVFVETITFPRTASSRAIQIKLQRVHGWDAGRAFQAALLLTKDKLTPLVRDQLSRPGRDLGKPTSKDGEDAGDPPCDECCVGSDQGDPFDACTCNEGNTCEECAFCG